MTYSLRHGPHEIPLTEGDFSIGRSTTCQLPLDDPLVSRNHALIRVRGEAVTIEDLGSRNGVRVNGETLEAPKAVAHGDLIRIGSQELVVVRRDAIGSKTLAQPATQRFNAFGVLGSLADKAIAMGRGEEAERLLSPPLREFLKQVQGGAETEEGALGFAADYALKLAKVTGAGRWVDYVIQLHMARSELVSAAVLDELYAVARRVDGVNVSLLREYVRTVKEHGEKNARGPAERFLLGRLEGLLRVIV